MASFNKVILVGNLTRDPELRYLPKGTAVAQFTLAVNRSWKTESGENKEEVSFIDVEAFGRQAEVIGQYMKKGRAFLVEGRLKQDVWEDKNTQKKQSKIKVALESFTFIDGNRGDGAGSPEGSSPVRNTKAATKPTDAAAEPDGTPTEEDDVPF